MNERLMWYLGATLPSVIIYWLSFALVCSGLKRRFGWTLKYSLSFLLFVAFWAVLILIGLLFGENTLNPITSKAILFLIAGIGIWILFRIIPRPAELVDNKDDKK